MDSFLTEIISSSDRFREVSPKPGTFVFFVREISDCEPLSAEVCGWDNGALYIREPEVKCGCVWIEGGIEVWDEGWDWKSWDDVWGWDDTWGCNGTWDSITFLPQLVQNFAPGFKGLEHDEHEEVKEDDGTKRWEELWADWVGRLIDGIVGGGLEVGVGVDTEEGETSVDALPNLKPHIVQNFCPGFCIFLQEGQLEPTSVEGTERL